jgi:hypothetical protein
LTLLERSLGRPPCGRCPSLAVQPAVGRRRRSDLSSSAVTAAVKSVDRLAPCDPGRIPHNIIRRHTPGNRSVRSADRCQCHAGPSCRRPSSAATYPSKNGFGATLSSPAALVTRQPGPLLLNSPDAGRPPAPTRSNPAAAGLISSPTPSIHTPSAVKYTPKIRGCLGHQSG